MNDSPHSFINVDSPNRQHTSRGGVDVDTAQPAMATLLFKQAVEMGMLMNVLAAMTDVDDETLRKLRYKCVEDAKRSNGSISFAAVAKSHRNRERS